MYLGLSGGSRAAATSKMERFLIIVKALHLGCCSSSGSAAGTVLNNNESYEDPVIIYLLKFNNENTRTMCEICSKLTEECTTTMMLFWCLY